jgi:hypothetical protein
MYCGGRHMNRDTVTGGGLATSELWPNHGSTRVSAYLNGELELQEERDSDKLAEDQGEFYGFLHASHMFISR